MQTAELTPHANHAIATRFESIVLEEVVINHNNGLGEVKFYGKLSSENKTNLLVRINTHDLENQVINRKNVIRRTKINQEFYTPLPSEKFHFRLIKMFGGGRVGYCSDWMSATCLGFKDGSIECLVGDSENVTSIPFILVVMLPHHRNPTVFPKVGKMIEILNTDFQGKPAWREAMVTALTGDIMSYAYSNELIAHRMTASPNEIVYREKL